MVSQHINKLEQEIGAKLLNRTTRVTSLTSAGEALFSTAEQVLDRLNETLSGIQKIQNEPTGLLRINSQTDFGARYVIPAIKAFRDIYPQVSFDIHLEDRISNLNREHVDIAMIMSRRPLEDSAYYSSNLNKGGELIVCASPAYIELHGKPKDVTEFGQHKHIIHGTVSNPTKFSFKQPGAESKSVILNGQVTTNASLGVQCLALNGMGLAILPQLIADPHLQAGSLQRLMLDHQLARYEIYAVYRQKQYTPYVQRTFLNWFKLYLVDYDDDPSQDV